MTSLRAVFLAAFAVAAVNGRAADWDHDENIEAAVRELAGIYRGAGAQPAATAVEACYSSLPELTLGDARLQRLEYCAGMDYAGHFLRRATQEAGAQDGSPFFAAQNLRVRLTALQQFITDPNVENQILLAWGRAAAGALEKHSR